MHPILLPGWEWKVPPFQGSLKHLKTLWLDDNQLSDLPVCLCQLEGLTTLRLSGNDLSYIPPSISSMLALQVLVSLLLVLSNAILFATDASMILTTCGFSV